MMTIIKMAAQKKTTLKTFNRIPRYIVLLLCFSLMFFSCTDNFVEINTNTNLQQPESVDPEVLLTYVLNRGASERYDQWRGNLIYCSQWAQQLSGDWEVDRYITTNEDWISAWWNDSYLRIGKNIQNLIDITDASSSIHHMAIIFKVFYFQRLTDMYGDMPYSEANKGALFSTPKYDTQEEIYNSFINELTTSIDGLDNATDVVSNADILFQGDISKWKKFANSILLRIGMRLQNVDPTLASSTCQQAIDGGVMESNDDIAVVTFSGSNTGGPNANGIGEVFQDFGITGHNFRYSDEVVNFILENDDPREDNLMDTYRSDGTVDNTVGSGNHLGRPNGIDPSFDDFVFAQPRRDVMVGYDSPAIYFSYAEVEFLKAEAIVLGWVSGNPMQAYENGIRAACKQLSLYPNSEDISDNSIDKYLLESRIKYRDDRAIEQINTQKWIALLFDGFEAFSNMRRSGFPNVTPGLNDGESNGQIPRRLRYPAGEKVNNRDQYNEAVSKLSNGDVITSKIWWDAN